MAADPQVFELRCGVQEYAWGKIGNESLVAALKASADPNFVIDPGRKYAELWMGTHPNCPSIALRPGLEEEPLMDWIRDHPDSLGKKVHQYFKGSLPFLFKVLSVRTALSIQAHPNKVQAEVLHQKQPDLYKDANHKPELAIALTQFIGLCSFRPIQEIAEFLKYSEEFRNAVGHKHAIKLITASCSQDMPLQREGLKDCFSGLMTQEKKLLKTELNKLVQRVNDMKERGEDLRPVEGDIILKLDREFPGDPGAFCVYFLNVLRLQPGEAMFLEAKMPHAYLSGDCMECMACSDNVVRAGLTSKYIDKHTLVEMLDYTCRTVAQTKFLGVESLVQRPPPTQPHGDTQQPNQPAKVYCGQEEERGEITNTIFHPPVPDFCISKVEIPAGIKEMSLESVLSASICIVIHGEGRLANSTMHSDMSIKKGSVFFVAASQPVQLFTENAGGMLLFRAYAGHF